MVRTLLQAVIVVSLSTIAQADIAVADRQPGGLEIVVVAEATDSVRFILPIGNAIARDLLVDEAGTFFGGTDGGIWSSPPAGLGFTVVSTFFNAEDLAFDSLGVLHAIQRFSALTPDTRLLTVDTTSGAQTTIATIPDFNMMGFDIPRAGPLEDGLIVTGFDPVAPGEGYLYRLVRQPDRSLVREGPFGPLAVMPFRSCAGVRGYVAWHPTARRSGETFLMTEGCTNRVLEFDLEGRLIREFAHIEPDPTVLDPRPGDPNHVFEDHVKNVGVAADDSVYVVTLRRIYHYAADGTLLAKIDHLLARGEGVANMEWIPFASASMTCDASGLGYWKRQCLPSSRRGGPAGGRTRPGAHPDFRDGRLPALVARVDGRLASFGVSACEALWPADPSDWHSKALMWLAAAHFNVEDGRLSAGCPIDIDGTDMKAADVLAQVEGFVASGDPAEWHEAVRLGQELCHERDHGRRP